jgi:hypothetical protein
MAVMEPGVLPSISLATRPTALPFCRTRLVPFFDGDDAGFVEDDSFAFDANQRVTGAQVDAHVDAEHAQEGIEDHAFKSPDVLDGAGAWA